MGSEGSRGDVQMPPMGSGFPFGSSPTLLFLLSLWINKCFACKCSVVPRLRPQICAVQVLFSFTVLTRQNCLNVKILQNPEYLQGDLEAEPMDTTRVAVIGAGVIGLSTAVCISESIPQCSIDVISDKFTPDTTSDVAAGILIPHVYPENPVHLQKQWFQETFDRLFAIANSSEAIDAGIHLISGWQIYRSIPHQERPFWADTVLGFRKMTESELKKFPQHVFGQVFTTVKCEGISYLPWLEKRLRGSGGQVHIRKVEDLWEFYGSYDIVINCSGLGSRELLGDLQLFPVRGQVLKVQAPWVKHFIRDEEGLTYIYPGTFDVTLGGTRQKDDWNLSPDPQNSREILARCQTLEPSLQGAWGIKEKVGLRPSRPGVRLQKEILVQDGHRLPVVHNYGHGSGGFCVHWGTALQAVQLVKELITTLKISTSKAKL